MLIDCACGATNRVPGVSSKKFKCGKCGHMFTPRELVKARHEPAHAVAPDSLNFGGPTHACNDDENCGWEGIEDDLENKRCPICGKRVHELE